MKNKDEAPSKTGEYAWRSMRYLAVAMAGYLFGTAVGGQATSRPPRVMLAVLGAAALVWVFRAGRKSVLHAASDAAAAAIADARAQAQAQATNVVQLGHGSSAFGGPAASTSAGRVPDDALKRPYAGYELVWDDNAQAYVFHDESTGAQWPLLSGGDSA